jgi:predicted amidophosphoribosyltransferase
MNKKHLPLCAGCGMELPELLKESLCPECEKKIRQGQVAWLKPRQDDRSPQRSLW